MRFLTPVTQRISVRAAIVAIAGLLLLLGGAGAAIGASTSHRRQGSAAHSAADPGSPWPGGIWQPDPAQYGTGTQSNVSFHMPDGTLLAGDITYPTDPSTGAMAAGKFPVIVSMDPYYHLLPTIGVSDPATEYLVERGYLQVTFDVRGTGRSYGDYTVLSAQQLRDFVEIADYLAKHLPGANGTAALEGQSYLGTDVLAAGRYVTRGSPIKALFAAAAGSDFFHEPFDQGGIPTLFSETYAQLTQYRDGGIAPDYNAEALSGGPLTYDGQFWQTRAPITSAPEIVRAQVPVLMVSGEEDYPAMTSLEMYVALQNASRGRSIWAPMSPNQPASGRYQLIWGTMFDTAGDGGGTAYFYAPYELEWLDTFLKGQTTDVTDTSTPLHLYEWQANQWVDASTYPVTRSYTRYYLNGNATSQAPYAMNNGGLSTTRPTSPAGADTITWAAPANSPTPASASNILDYTSEPFPNGALLAGPITARVYASSTTRNIMLVATLLDIAPDGTTTSVYNIWEADGALLGTDRAVDPSRSWYDSNSGLIFAYHPLTSGSQEPVNPGQEVAMDITLNPRMWTILPGHRLRLQITTQAPTLLAPTKPQVASLTNATFTIGRDSQNPSYIDLPLLPSNAFAPDTAWAQTTWTAQPYPSPAGTSGGPLGAFPFKIPPLGQ
jgi:uncharacterized protein